MISMGDLPSRESIWEACADEDGFQLSKHGREALGYCGDYWIESARIDSAAKAAAWVYHLSGKSWITTEAIRDLLDLALKNSEKILSPLDT